MPFQGRHLYDNGVQVRPQVITDIRCIKSTNVDQNITVVFFSNVMGLGSSTNTEGIQSML